jgi:hypothetical protein
VWWWDVLALALLDIILRTVPTPPCQLHVLKRGCGRKKADDEDLQYIALLLRILLRLWLGPAHRGEPSEWDPSGESSNSKSEQVKQCMDLEHCLHCLHLELTHLE